MYSSDQGFYLGEHGWFDKRWVFEESVRTPFLVRWPGATKAGTVNRDLVANVDFTETFLEAAGAPIPADMQGRSLVPILRGQQPADWRTGLYYQYYEYPAPHRVRPHYGVVTDRYKLVHFEAVGGPAYWELYDREKDPQEVRNVIADPGYAATRTSLERQLAQLRTELKVPEQTPARFYGNQPVDGSAPAPKKNKKKQP